MMMLSCLVVLELIVQSEFLVNLRDSFGGISAVFNFRCKVSISSRSTRYKRFYSLHETSLMGFIASHSVFVFAVISVLCFVDCFSGKMLYPCDVFLQNHNYKYTLASTTIQKHILLATVVCGDAL